ncbi:hypothetical protein TSUD_283280 [Trifolium subterraneum]|uniref:Reverse transcriptase domain-containing protein n=1 Tax=Trifolium subterraneum TaxID=3900 RepID=A0A2Z6NVL4_TRISU|nr:hypothetical protein TSUD_283280 [Trifolium subterraneum]
MLNAFNHYGEILEVVIPAKRDRGGKIFGFARFDRVGDARRFEKDLDNIIIGRDKISVNLSRYQRLDDVRRKNNNNEVSKGIEGTRRAAGSNGEKNDKYGKHLYEQQNYQQREKQNRSYAHAVMNKGNKCKTEERRQIVLSYQAEKKDMERLEKAFVGEVLDSGMTYNIQNAFHRQGYFGVKVTPLGSNLTLLEGQEEGEVQALIDDAKGWMDQWFKEIRPWSPKEIDIERIIWLRVYGIPVHAWNDNFFTKMVKPWGCFINSDDGTMKKTTMDVARLMIRTSCQQVVDEFVDVEVNGSIFHLRVLKDSYGPMRIMINQNKGPDGRDDGVSEEEEEEEGDRNWKEVVEEPEREMEDEEENLLAINPYVNANNDQFNISVSNLARINNTDSGREVSNSNSNFIVSNYGGNGGNEGGVNMQDSQIVKCGILLGQEEGTGGPQNSNNTYQSIAGGVNNRLAHSEEMGCWQRPNSFINEVCEGKDKQKGRVYSDGPRGVYLKLNKGNLVKEVEVRQKDSTHAQSLQKSVNPIPAKIRKQQQIIKSLNLKNQINQADLKSPSSVTNSTSTTKECRSRRSNQSTICAKRNPSLCHRSGKQSASSASSAGAVLCCSSLNSADIRNCNKRFVEQYEHDAAVSVWKGAVDLGVEGDEEDESFFGDGFLGICVEWQAVLVYIVNIYSPCTMAGGDFNSITKIGERRGSHGGSVYRERIEFSQFIDAMELVDIPVLGKKFTWFNSDCSAMSRLDRFLLSEGFIEKGGISNQWVGNRDISDHCPIWLESSNINWGPKPFKFNNCWLEHSDFLPFVKATWEKMNIHGKKAFIIKEKLKRLKEALKTWNQEVFGIMDLNIEKTVKDLNEIEELIANGDNQLDSVNSKELSKKFWEQLHFKESILQQKSRTKWIQEGDSNTRFFHASIKGRRRRNRIVKLKKGNEWIQGVTEIKNVTKDHFAKHFSEEWPNRPFLQGIDFHTLSDADNAFLVEPFNEEEVRETIWSCDGNKSPGPDGFNFNFMKACWSIVKSDVMAFLNEFHKTAILPKAVTASFLTLIPKKDHPQDLFDYRPICLIGCLYKILSKILANRLKTVLGKLISTCQSAFLPQRQILDGVVVLNEIIDLAKKRKDGCLLFKVDFERAYDTLKWMRACIFESSMSILVNGSPTEDFKVERGLRQGDPLSPFLFLIVAEGLTRLMKRAVEIGKFKGHQIRNNIQFQILQFADDTILMGEGSWHNVQTIKTLLRSFELVSGLKINFVKSKLYGISVEDRILDAGAAFLSCRSDAIPFKFLGIPVGANPRRRETWKPVIDAMSHRLSGAPILIGAKHSIWWKNVMGKSRGDEADWFKTKVRACVSSGTNIGFWNFKWFGNSSFRELYPSLYAKEECPNVSISERLDGNGDVHGLAWQWSEQLSTYEEEQVAELTELLVGLSLQPGNPDSWRWIPDSLGLFTVKSCYNALLSDCQIEVLDTNVLNAINQLWKNDVPSKVLVFGWRLLLARLPTRLALNRRGRNSFTQDFRERSQTNAGKRKHSLGVTPACIQLFKGYPKAAQRLYLFVKQHTTTLQLNNSYPYAPLSKVRRRNFGVQSQTDQFSSKYMSCHYAELLAVIFKLPTEILRGQDSLIITHLYIEVLGNFEEQESPLQLQHLFL